MIQKSAHSSYLEGCKWQIDPGGLIAAEGSIVIFFKVQLIIILLGSQF